MPEFRNKFTAGGSFTVEAGDMYQADEIARNMSQDEIMELCPDFEIYEVNDDEFPEEW